MHYSALIVQRRLRSHNGSPAWEARARPLRIPTVTGVTWAEEDPGGFTDASFTIPTRHARYDPQDFQQNTLVWIYDGATPVFYGHILKAIPQPDGIDVTLNGAYRKLTDTAMRIVWSDADLGTWVMSNNSISGASINIRSDGSLRFAIPDQTQVSVGDHISADYFLFDEPAGPRDGKLIDGFAFEQDSASYGGGSWQLEVQGRDAPVDSSPDTLFTAQNDTPISRAMVSDGSSGDDANGWPSQNGYRCIRIGLYAQNSGTTQGSRVMSFSVLRVSTRARSIRTAESHNTSTLVRDLWADAANGYDIDHLLQEEYAPSTGGAVVGAIEASDQLVSGVAFKDWTAPGDILETLAATDGQVLGMWFPTRRYRTGSHVVSAGVTKNYWYRQPPELVHSAWADLADPDYLVRLDRGAVWQSDGQGDELTEATYANYSTTSGKQRSVFVEDQSDENWLSQQGYHEASVWQVAPSVGDATASALADQYNRSKRQPSLSGTITITTQKRGALLTRGGGIVTKLSTVHAGTVVWIIDAKTYRRGRITRVEHAGTSAGVPESVTLTVNGSFATQRLDRRLARMALRAEQTRSH